MKAELNNTVRIYQDFCDRNLKLSKREHELELSISELEVKKIELQKIITGLQDHASIPRESNEDSNILDPEFKLMEEVNTMNDILISSTDKAIDYQPSINEITRYPPQVDTSSRAIIVDTKDLGCS